MSEVERVRRILDGEENAPELEEPFRRHLRLTRASEIEPEPVVWMWEDNGAGRIPSGALVVAAGREGTGKSSFGIWMAAQVTTGTLPGPLFGHPYDVIYVAVEDSWKHTLVPRLMAAGADLDRVWRVEAAVSEDETGVISLPHDLLLLERSIGELGVRLVVLDPLMSTISAKIDTHKERDTRTALDPLARLADRTGAAILGVAHFNKGIGTDPSSLITGSGAFKNVPRAVFGFAVDPDSENGARVMTQTKNSLGLSDLPSLAYRIQSTKVDTPKGVADVGRFVFEGVAKRTVEEVLAGGDPDETKAKVAAADFLRATLDGQWCRSKDIAEEAKEAHDISPRTLARARKGLAVVAKKFPTGPDGAPEWWQTLPEQSATLPPPESKSANP
ncbi:AAA family ATPase [Streptosporangium sp. NPDC006007]|uniref:AAA family ATPase n=1 Tax=Streptosporangium sp. NPDC006007 TaxID=3154575 RepID=UPI0033AAADC2